MNYFDTIAGQRFTGYTMPALIEQIEALNERLSKKPQQYTVRTSKIHATGVVEEEIANGSRFVSCISGADDFQLIIFEK